MRFNHSPPNLHQINPTSWIKSSNFSTFCGRNWDSFSWKWRSFRNVDPLFCPANFFRLFLHFDLNSLLKHPFFMLSRRAKNVWNMLKTKHFNHTSHHSKITLLTRFARSESDLPALCSVLQRAQLVVPRGTSSPRHSSLRSILFGILPTSLGPSWLGRQAASAWGFASCGVRPTSWPHSRGWRSTPHSSGLELVTWVCFANGFATPSEPGGREDWGSFFTPILMWRSLCRIGSVGLNGASPLTSLSILHNSQAGGIFMVYFDIIHDLLVIQWRAYNFSILLRNY